MKIAQAIEALQRIVHVQPRAAESELMVAVHRPGSLGGTPAVAVTALHAGFDWDAGKVILEVAPTVTTLTVEEITAITTSVQKGQSWHAYQSFKRQASRITELERELEQLRQDVGAQTGHPEPAGDS